MTNCYFIFSKDSQVLMQGCEIKLDKSKSVLRLRHFTLIISQFYKGKVNLLKTEKENLTVVEKIAIRVMLMLHLETISSPTDVPMLTCYECCPMVVVIL